MDKMDNDNKTLKVKMSGHLNLKIKKRMISSWKHYWFVLEDRLLLYYRSKEEYEAISPCKGSINLGPPCAVKSLPSVPNAFQIEARSVTYTLKAENSDEQKKWLQVILAALNQNQNFSSDGTKKLSHFRYSLDNLFPEVEPNDSQVLNKHPPLARQNTMPRLKSNNQIQTELIQRLQKMGAHSYGGSLEAISKKVTKSIPSPVLVEENPAIRERRVCGENIYERISGDSQDSNRESFLVDNENYSVPLRMTLSLGDSDTYDKPIVPLVRETKSLIVENDQYARINDEVIYAEPKIERIDCNKNSVTVENSFYASANVLNIESNSDNSPENLYEDLDKFDHYSVPKIKCEENSSQTSEKSCRNRKEKKNVKKSRSFIRRVWKRKKKEKKEETEKNDRIYAEVDNKVVEKMSITDNSTIQMLSELHNILEQHKTKMKAKQVVSSGGQPTSTPTPSESDQVCPSLPPKTLLLKQPIEQVRSLDEILEDLDKEKIECKSKVQMLIEKFSEPEEDVILRKRDSVKVSRHSDELNKLLDELVKVTSAPIMTPGLTNSLLNPNLTDEEWLKLLPVRQRRLSEPDYDVPRLHKSLQLQTEPENTDVIPATRFFGPVLPPAITNNKEESLTVSMTPDSLEVEAQHKHESHFSYTSHNYDRFSQNCNQGDDKIIYALPKSYVSVATHIVNTCQNICGGQTDECTVVYKTVKNVEVQDEVFKDSLELCNETSTEF